MVKRFFRNLATILSLLLLNGFSFATHAVAMPMPSHQMGSTNHVTNSTSMDCATLCKTAVINKEDILAPVDNEDDDDPDVPYYIQSYAAGFADPLTKDKRYAEVVKPPPKIPVYILYGVFRV